MKAHAQDREELVGWIDALLDDFTRLGYLDDARYAASQTRALRTRGASRRGIEAKLREKGVDAEVVRSQLADSNVDDELRAALRHLRKRRHGPFRRDDREVDAATAKKKELAGLGRAGFSYELSARALSLPLEEAEAILQGE